MGITLQDIAVELDISTATVSRSLRQDSLIHPETRARVNEAATRMGYRGRVRRPRRVSEQELNSRALGLLLRHDSVDDARLDPNLTKMMAGVMAVAEANRMLVQIHAIGYDEKRRMDEDASAVPMMAQPGSCQAFIVHGEQDERDITFLSKRAPVVSMGRVYRGLPIDSAVGDNMDGIQEMVTHLVELGHRRLAWAGTEHISSFMNARQGGFIQGCLEHGLKFGPEDFYGPELYGKPESRDENAIFAALESGVTGFVCGSDSIARKVLEVVEKAGRRVPDDVSVTGFDASSNSTKTRHITSIDPHFFEIGQLAARLAFQRIAHPMGHPNLMSVRGNIVLGDSTGPLKIS